jgi:putative sigma-54 modulation protein
VVVSERVPGKPIPVEEALAQLEHSGDEFLAFIDAATQAMAVLYRRKDGGYALIAS